MGGVVDWLLSLPGTYPELRIDLLGHLLLASILGGGVGWEREHAHKPAGLRTHMLICMGAALITDLSVRAAAASAGSSAPFDPTRIAAQIVTGVGFLGAGTIMQARGSVMGLTTAATMWVVAGIGMAVGFGAIIEAVGTTLLVLVALIPLRTLEERAKARMERNQLHVTAVGEDLQP